MRPSQNRGSVYLNSNNIYVFCGIVNYGLYGIIVFAKSFSLINQILQGDAVYVIIDNLIQTAPER